MLFCDPSNKLYFTFLKPLLRKFERVNALFQKEADHTNLVHKLQSFFLALLQRIVLAFISVIINFKFSFIYLPIEQVDFGHLVSC